MIKIESLVVGLYMANCYFISDKDNLVIIDPGAESFKIAEKIKTYNRKNLVILLTHGHFDHHGACDRLYEQFKCSIYIAKEDQLILADFAKNCSYGYEVKTTCPTLVHQSNKYQFGEIEIEVIKAPGHTDGSCLYLVNQQYLFTGDVLFKNTIGRTDFLTGNPNKMQQTLTMIKKFNPNFIVYPGHSDSSTIAAELASNPYLK